MNELNFTVDSAKCIKCGACIKDCPRRIIHYHDGLPAISPAETDQCIRCQHCLAICPTGAVSICGLKPEDSIPLGPTPAVTPDDLSRLVRARRTMRQYRRENVDRRLIDRLLTDTSYAPTGGNTCDLTFTVVDDRLALGRILEAIVTGLEQAIRENVAMPEFMHKGIHAYRHEHRDEIFRGAPHLLVVSAVPPLIAAMATW